MDIEKLKKSFELKSPPDHFPNLIKALWYDGKNNWEMAHNIAQLEEGNRDYDRIHAYLHRKEGDEFNARYWYKRINLAFPTITLEEEWEQLVLEYSQ